VSNNRGGLWRTQGHDLVPLALAKARGGRAQGHVMLPVNEVVPFTVCDQSTTVSQPPRAWTPLVLRSQRDVLITARKSAPGSVPPLARGPDLLAP